MGMVSVTWVAMLFLQGGAPTPVDPDRPSAPEGPVHRKAEEPAVVETQRVAPPENVPGTVRLRSEMGRRYRLVEATVAMDGEQVAYRRAPDGSELQREFNLYQGPMVPGRHAVNVILVYQGRNAGLFNYMDDYTFRVQSSYAFEATADRPAVLDVVAKERKGISVPLEQKPMLEISAAPGSGATSVSVETAGNAQGQ